MSLFTNICVSFMKHLCHFYKTFMSLLRTFMSLPFMSLFTGKKSDINTYLCHFLSDINSDFSCSEMKKWFTRASAKELEEWSIGSDGGFRCRNRLCMPDADNLRKDILDESHKSQMTIHPGGTKI